MAKHIKIFNTIRSTTHIVTEEGLRLINANQNNKIEIIGECDEKGNLFSDISEGNFLSKQKPETKKETVKTEEKKQEVKVSIDKETGEPIGNISYQPTLEELQAKIENDKIAKEEYEKNKKEKFKKVSNIPNK